MSDYISKSALIDSILQNVVITTEEGLDLRGEIVDLIKNQPTLDEKEIIRKPFERVVEQLNGLMPIRFNGFGKTLITVEDVIKILKEECEINE